MGAARRAKAGAAAAAAAAGAGIGEGAAAEKGGEMAMRGAKAGAAA